MTNKMRIRTWYDLGSYSDNEVNTGKSKVEDTEWYETLDQMIPRILAGQVKVRPKDLYEVDEDRVDDALDDEPVIERLDDLTDIDRSLDILHRQRRQRSDKVQTEDAKDEKELGNKPSDGEDAAS